MTDLDLDLDLADDPNDDHDLSFGTAIGPRPALRWRVLPTLKGRVPRPWVRALDRRLRRAARRIGVPGPELPGVSVAIVDDPEIQRLNLAHMGKDRPTDVLSFPARPPGPRPAPPGGDHQHPGLPPPAAVAR